MTSIPLIFLALIVVAAALAAWILISIAFRRVVESNAVHVVLRSGSVTSYGLSKEAGNVYYDWPYWVPRYGVTVTHLPVSNFDIRLEGYEAYDINRVPFKVDVVAFFRIVDTDLAAQRVSSIDELKRQLTQIVQGAVRKVLAGANVDKIMLERAHFGDEFTNEVKEQLKEWGSESVKSMELMDIRDGGGKDGHHESRVITNIMAKQTSAIEADSRKTVAENTRAARTAEIEAQRAVQISEQEADQAIGQRTAEKDRAVGIANEQSKQSVLQESRATKERELEVARVALVRAANNQREAEVVKAEQDKTTITLRAEGELEARKRHAEGIKVEGDAKAAAEAALLMAPVTAQLNLATGIGENKGYQEYLVTIRRIEAEQAIGTAQAEALANADIKVIATAGDAPTGLRSAGDAVSPRGGAVLGGAVEAFAATPVGAAVLSAAGVRANGAAQ